MAEKRTIELEVKDNVKSLKAQYKEAVVELQRVSAAYVETSQEAIRAAKAAAELKDQIGFTNDMVNSFNPDGKFNALSKSFGGVLDGFQAVEGGLGLIGVEGEAVQEAMLRVQSAMAFSQGIQGVLEAKDSFKQLGANIKDVYLQIFKKNAATTAGAAVDKANVVTTGAQAVASSGLATAQGGVAVSTGVASNAMKLFRVALISTGIGAIVVAVGLLIANFDKLVEGVMWAREKFEKLGTGVKILISVMFHFIGIIYGTIKALEAMGIIDDVNTAKAKKNAHDHTEAVIKGADKRAKAIKKEQTQNDAKAQREIDLAKASGKATYEMELSKAKAHLASGRVYLEVQKSKMKAIKAEMDLLLASEDQDSDRYKALKKRAEAVRKIMDETYKDNVDTNHAIQIMQAEHNKEMADKAKEAGDKAKQNAEQNRKAYIDNLKKQYDDQSKLEEEAENQKLALMEDGIAKEKALRQDAYNDYRDNFLKERIADEQAALDKQFETGKISREEYNKQLEALRVNAESKLTEQERQILVNAKDLLNKDLLAIDEKHQAEVLKRTQDFQKKIQDEEKKRQLDFDMQVESLQELNYQASLTDQKRELYLIDEKYAEMERMAKGNADAEKTITEAKKRDIDEINKKYDEAEKARQKEKIAQGLDLARGQFAALGDLAASFNFKSKAAAKAAFNVKKGADIAAATIDTYKAATGAYSSMSSIPVVGPALGAVAAAMAVTAGLLNVKKIASQKFEGGGVPSGGGGGGGEGALSGGMSGGSQAPSFNVVGNNGLNQLAQLQQQPTQAYVVSGQVTTAQSLDRNRIQNATL
jgi:hypothetical protein